MSVFKQWPPGGAIQSAKQIPPLIAASASAASGFTVSPCRNLIVNGGFEIWQMGTTWVGAAGRSGLAGPCSLPDHWSFLSAVASNFSQQPGFAPGSLYSLRCLRPAGNTDVSFRALIQDLETPLSQPFAGQAVTLSLTARAGATWSAPNLTVQVISGTGTNQARRATGYTGQTNVCVISPVLSTTAQQFSVSGVVPANSTQIGFIITWNPTGTAGAADYVEFDNVQLELGSVATPFEVVPFDSNLFRCLTWVQKSFPYAQAPIQNSGSRTGAYQFVASKAGAVAIFGPSNTLSPRMRAGSTLVPLLYNPLAANANFRDVTGGVDCSASSVLSGEGSFIGGTTGNAATVVGALLAAHFVIDGGI